MNTFKLELTDIRRGQDIGKFLGHKYVWLACPQCGKERWVDLGSTKQPSFNGLCRRCNKKIGGWRRRKVVNRYGEGRYMSKDGYILVHLEPDDFFYKMANHNSYVGEHRLIIAKYLGRCLLPWEIVHHKNGIRDDNKLENLELLPTNRQHLPSMTWQRELRKRDRRIEQLEKRVTLLEAENVLLRSEGVAHG